MQLASSQFSPRVLRHFLANDVKIQEFIGLFIGTLALCILPQAASALFNGMPFFITLAVGIFFAMKCLVWSYPRMITYLSENMNVAAIANRVKEEVVHEINELYRDTWEPGRNMLYKTRNRSGKRPFIEVPSPFETGYLESIDYLKLEKLVVSFADSHPDAQNLLVFLKPVVGEFILKQSSVLLVVEHPEEMQQEQLEAMKREFSAIAKQVFSVHIFRSYTQDINFGVGKLVDIAVKAISPAVNDPTTCMNCIDQLGDIVRELATRQYPSTNACKLRAKHIIVNEFNFDELVDFCFDQIFQWGKEDPIVVKRLVRIIGAIAGTVTNPYNLKVLIQEVEDMELPDIYNEENFRNRRLKISKEKLFSIQRELHYFRLKARARIAELDKQGLLKLHEHQYADNTQIIKEEKAALDYLQLYRKDPTFVPDEYEIE